MPNTSSVIRITRYRFLSAERRAFYQRPRVFRLFALEPQSPADSVRFTLRAFDLQLTMRHTPDVSSAVVSTRARARDSATRFHSWRVGLIFLSAGGYFGNNLRLVCCMEVRFGTRDSGHESAPRCFPLGFSRAICAEDYDASSDAGSYRRLQTRREAGAFSNEKGKASDAETSRTTRD